MTLNLGTAAYMAPELSSLTNWVTQFGTDDTDTDVLQDARMNHREKENVLADKHIEALNGFDLSSAQPSSDSHGSSRSRDNSAVRTTRDLASKVTTNL